MLDKTKQRSWVDEIEWADSAVSTTGFTADDIKQNPSLRMCDRE